MLYFGAVEWGIAQYLCIKQTGAAALLLLNIKDVLMVGFFFLFRFFLLLIMCARLSIIQIKNDSQMQLIWF